VLAEAPRASREYRLAAIRYAERRALQATAGAFRKQLTALDGLEYYQVRTHILDSRAGRRIPKMPKPTGHAGG